VGFLGLPTVLDNPTGSPKTTGRANALLSVVCPPAAPPAADMHDLGSLAHGGGTLDHEITQPAR
jgi:hypothetical protein